MVYQEKRTAVVAVLVALKLGETKGRRARRVLAPDEPVRSVISNGISIVGTCLTPGHSGLPDASVARVIPRNTYVPLTQSSHQLISIVLPYTRIRDTTRTSHPFTRTVELAVLPFEFNFTLTNPIETAEQP